MRTYLDFEKPIAELESKVEELKSLEDNGNGVSIAEEIATLEAKAQQALEYTYSRLTPWQKTQVARHPERPHCLDYIHALVDEFIPLAGDRFFAEDHAIVGGLGRFRGDPVMVIGQEKGSNTEARLERNFGMARPEGYRKAIRLMSMAQKFSLPVLTFVDTPGAYPGVGAEERGQAEAIARSIDRCMSLGVPIVTVVIGEGGSGGAVAIATANYVVMLEHAIYTVASPEAAASILWHDSNRAKDAATSMRITAEDLKELGVVDSIVPEPLGGAHRDENQVLEAVGREISGALKVFEGMDADQIRSHRREKYLRMGVDF